MILNRLAILAAVLVPQARSDCLDLTPYASSPDDLEALTGGGEVYDFSPVFFDIPSDFVTGDAMYCLENITIPSRVGWNECNESQQCWLTVGLHAKDDQNDEEIATSSCTDSEGVTSDCYACFCTGLSMSSGSSEHTLSAECGLRDDSEWGSITCTDVAKGRYENLVDNVRIASNSSTVHISICPETSSSCNVCQGGLHPSVKVGIQWTSDLEEQCFNSPFQGPIPTITTCWFGTGPEMGMETFAIIGLSLFVSIAILASCSYCCIRRNRVLEEQGRAIAPPRAGSLETLKIALDHETEDAATVDTESTTRSCVAVIMN